MDITRQAPLPRGTPFITSHASPLLAPLLCPVELPQHVARNPETLARLEAAVDAWDEARTEYYKTEYDPAQCLAKALAEESVAAILGYHRLNGLSPAHIRETVRRFREDEATRAAPSEGRSDLLNEASSREAYNELPSHTRWAAVVGLHIARQIVDREFHQRNDARDAGEQAAILSVVAKIAKALDDEIAKANERST